MSEEKQPLSAPNTAVQRLAREAIWVQGVTQTLLHGVNLTPVVPVQQEVVTRLARSLFKLAENGFTVSDWQEVVTASQLGVQVAVDIQTVRELTAKTPVPEPVPEQPAPPTKPRRKGKNVASPKPT